MNLLTDVLTSEELKVKTPRLESVQEARVAHKNKMNTIQKLSSSGATGFTEDKSMQYVAQIDQSIWAAVLAVFARHDPETGNFVDDGLLYITDETGRVKLNKDFFFALLSGPLKDHDMRGKVSIME